MRFSSRPLQRGSSINATLAHGPRFHGDGTVTFRVWAPAAKDVTLELAGASTSLEARPHGWFEIRTQAAHGQDYGFRLDGGPQRPDPASRWQPAGVHGASRLFDPARVLAGPVFRAAPLSSAVVYELHVGTFTLEGTMAAATGRLADLADLGITHVEILPINAFNGEHGWGYDGVAWYAVHEPYGGPEDFARFVEACHSHGLAVVLDVVYNHIGPSGNYLDEFGPYVTHRYSTPWGGALNLDGPDSDPVRQFIVSNALYWLSTFRVDALRLDAVHALIDNASVHILAELHDAVAALSAREGRPLQLIAETDRNDPSTVRSREAGGLGMDGQWADDLHHAVHTALTGERDGYYVDFAGLPDVAATYQQGFVYDGHYSVFRQCTVGAPLGDTPGHRLVACIQNHDQVGNRALGERLTTLVAPELVEIAIVLLCAAPTTPLLFMGEEYGETNPFQFFTNHPEPDVADAVRTGRLQEFASFASFSGTEVPDPQDPATFERSRLDWSRASSPEGQARRRLWQRLLRLRREIPALGNGRRDLVEVLTVDDEHLAIVRRDPDGSGALVLANLAEDDWHLSLPDARWRLLLDTGRGHDAGCEPEGDHGLCMHGRSASLWSMDPVDVGAL